MNAPWKWSEDGLQLIDATGRTVLKIRPSDATQEEFDAVAAVPEMLSALKTFHGIVSRAKKGKDGWRTVAFCDQDIWLLAAAIARAEGV